MSYQLILYLTVRTEEVRMVNHDVVGGLWTLHQTGNSEQEALPLLPLLSV